MTTAKAMRFLSLVTAVNVLVASGFAIAGLVDPVSILPAGSVATQASRIFALYAAGRTVPLALMAWIAIYRRSATALMVLGTLAGLIQVLDAGVGLVQHDLGKSLGPLLIAALQFHAVFALKRSSRTH
jgi:hypothetical protein